MQNNHGWSFYFEYNKVPGTQQQSLTALIGFRLTSASHMALFIDFFLLK